MVLGRPSLYDPKYVHEIIEHFSVPVFTTEVMNGKVQKFPNPLPTFSGFARKIHVEHETLHNWCKEHRDFFVAYNQAKELQKEWLINLGMSGLAPPASFIFVSKNVTDMKDQRDVDLTSGGEKITGFNYIKPNDLPADIPKVT